MHVAHQMDDEPQGVERREAVRFAGEHPHRRRGHLHDIVVAREVGILHPIVTLGVTGDVDVMPSVIVLVAWIG